MSNCDFSLKHYQEILEIALDSGYKFFSFDQLHQIQNEQLACVLRHDIDYCPEWAPQIANIENNLGIKATYFFQICSDIYNLRSKENIGIIHNLKRDGHELGLHLDVSWADDISWDNLTDFCDTEKALFQTITNVPPCKYISFHNTHKFGELVLGQQINGMYHTYEAPFFKDMKYLSDSQDWYEGCVCKIFKNKKYKKIQLLTHPYIWPQTSNSFLDSIKSVLQHKHHKLLSYFVNYHPICRKNKLELQKQTYNGFYDK